MSKIPTHIVDEIMQTALVEEVIGDFVQLKRAGSNLKGLSPFTDERTPSFVVSPAKQIFKCFSTGIGGTVVTFLMEKEHFTYPEALRWLADKYGINIPAPREQTKEELEQISEKESLFVINDFANQYFQNNIRKNPEGKAIGLSYFLERGFTQDTIDQFQLGYCLDVSDDFTKAALKKGYKLQYLTKVGLTKQKEDYTFDFYRGRVLFPIHSISGRVLGFGGRTLKKDKKVAKYYNSPESPIYNKSEILYGLYFSKGAIIKYDECLLCEGYTDVISMFQSGVENVVASSGTSLTREQIRLVKRYTKNLTILYDGDAAGIKASFRGIDLILEEGLNVQVVLFPEGEDPDSFAKNHTLSEIKEMISVKKQDFISFKAGVLIDGSENDPIQRSKLIREVVQSVALIPDQITRSVYVQEIAKKFEIDEKTISNELIKLLRARLTKEQQGTRGFQSSEVQTLQKQAIQVGEAKNKQTPTFEYELDLIRLMLLFGTHQISIPSETDEKAATSVIELIYDELVEDDLKFENPLCKMIFEEFECNLKNQILLSTSYFKNLENQKVVSFVSHLQSNDIELSYNWVNKYNIVTKSEGDDLYKSVMNSIYNFKYHKVDEVILNIKSRIKSGATDEDMLELLAEQMSWEKIKKSFSDKLGRIIIK
ncbi:MAG: DNA primase [Cryomorphaceae bacterium]|nr:DNA primase [Cryomorphaceae bacterium]|tara:strand:- start:8723 stop:10681 length:1959 start_codon:yes stop_codon:yes gene_type:complete